MTATGTIVVRTLSDGTKTVGVKNGETTTWFPGASSHIVDAMKNHPGVNCTVTYSAEGEPPVNTPSMVVVG